MPIAIDAVADAALVARRIEGEPYASERRCDACDKVIVGEPAGWGFFLWTRGDEVRFEEPPLCGRCATAIGVTARMSWSVEEEEG